MFLSNPLHPHTLGHKGVIVLGATGLTEVYAEILSHRASCSSHLNCTEDRRRAGADGHRRLFLVDSERVLWEGKPRFVIVDVHHGDDDSGCARFSAPQLNCRLSCNDLWRRS